MYNKIVEIKPEFNKDLANLIRSVLVEYRADRPGTVFTDPTTDNLAALFDISGGIYFVLLVEGKVAGGAGIYPTPNLPKQTCELVKMYLLPAYRGRGFGKQLMIKCLLKAEELGYKYCYIETMQELKEAVQLYIKYGFKPLDAPLGNSGHFGCDLWFMKTLGQEPEH
jgi:putative acetyltransferase